VTVNQRRNLKCDELKVKLQSANFKKKCNTQQDRQCTYQLNTEEHWCNHFYLAKTITNTYSECVYVVSVTHHAMRMRRIIICGMSESNTYFHIISQTARFSEKCYWTWNACFDFVYNFCPKHFSF